MSIISRVSIIYAMTRKEQAATWEFHREHCADFLRDTLELDVEEAEVGWVVLTSANQC